MSHAIIVQLVRYYTEPFIFHAFSRWLIHDTGTTDLWVGGSNPSGRAKFLDEIKHFTANRSLA